jgi:hypothetical protein
MLLSTMLCLSLILGLVSAANTSLIAINSSSSDSSYLYEKFQEGIVDPYIHVDPIHDVCLGENVTITGTTNLPAGELLVVEIYPENLFGPKVPIGHIELQSGGVKIQNGSSGINTFKKVLQYNASVTEAATYLVFVTCGGYRACNGTKSFFNLIQCYSGLPENNNYSTTQTTHSSPITTKAASGMGILPVGIIIAMLVISQTKRDRK